MADACEPAGSAGTHLRLALVVIATAARLGGSPAAAIDRTAGTLRQRAVDADERNVHAAQARLSAHVLTAVPLAMLLLLLVTDDDVRVTATSTLGATCDRGRPVAERDRLGMDAANHRQTVMTAVGILAVALLVASIGGALRPVVVGPRRTPPHTVRRHAAPAPVRRSVAPTRSGGRPVAGIVAGAVAGVAS